MNPSLSSRIETFRNRMADHGIDTMMVLVEENRRYLSGFTGEDNGYDESSGVLFITQNKLLLATDSRFVFQAKTEAPGYDIYGYKKGLAAELPDILAQLNTQILGFEPAKLSVKDHERMKQSLDASGSSVKLAPISDLVESLRIIKDEEEIDIIRRALAITEQALQNLLPSLVPGMSEKEAAWLLEKKLREMGAEGLSFPSIVACGVNTAKPHAHPSDHLFTTRAPVLFDWGIKLKGYCSDITRTFFLDKPDGRFMEIFDVVKTAQERATAAIREGVSTKEIDSLARDYIKEKGYGDFFGHGLGHGVGLAIHEAPRLSPMQDIPLKSGMVVTIEPGIYLPEWGGIRLENMVVVRKDGPEVLNSTTVEEFLPQ
ncbi:Xaa-Pro peptidase family protein [Desulfobotulus sp. H1]|uniref:Xaa-Pro peptidase family protein n=1 Tax=Desulfobotulus pelophilus TaxID=2823377 RepID=A0ABT3N8Z7_9BACT|nr:Xaa-Pro peptidase family protein [Desulfobotulus pelophilus]MCW7753497.1 Xaa-Pro peptidase family protein [Desulfobotulus pelophilus]